jgi:hypothetical protein
VAVWFLFRSLWPGLTYHVVITHCEPWRNPARMEPRPPGITQSRLDAVLTALDEAKEANLGNAGIDDSDVRWEELRSLARAALTRLQWPVELLAPHRSVYVPCGPVDAGRG